MVKITVVGSVNPGAVFRIECSRRIEQSAEPKVVTRPQNQDLCHISIMLMDITFMGTTIMGNPGL